MSSHCHYKFHWLLCTVFFEATYNWSVLLLYLLTELCLIIWYTEHWVVW